MSKQLVAIKLIHTVVWLILSGAIFYILYSGLFNRINMYTWIAVGMIVLEGAILLIFKWSCPLTVVARRYSDSTRNNFDIYLPEWLAKHNKTICTTLFLASVVLVLIRMLNT